MTFRIILILSLSMSLSPLSFAQVGTIEEAINAAINGQEPVYMTRAMISLSKEIHQFVSDRKINEPTQKFALWHTMRVVMCATYAAARNAAMEVAGHDALLASKHTALSATRDVLLSATVDPDDAGFEESFHAALNLAEEAALDHVYDAVQEALAIQGPSDFSGAIASRVAEWVTLNLLLTDFDAIVLPTYEKALDLSDRYPFANPFNYPQFFDRFYRDSFSNTVDDAMFILAPWLIHMVPLNLMGVHRRCFNFFMRQTYGSHRGPPAPRQIPIAIEAAASILDSILPSDVLDFADD